MTLGMEGSGLAQVGMEMIEIQNQLVASGKEWDGGLTQPDLHISSCLGLSAPLSSSPR